MTADGAQWVSAHLIGQTDLSADRTNDRDIGLADAAPMRRSVVASGYTLQSGDISNGTVTVRLRVKVDPSGNKTLFHDAGMFAITNLGAAQV